MPKGCLHLDHEYPEEEYSDYGYAVVGKYRFKTKPEVIHAESHAITKLARSNESSEGAIMFCTHSPCVDCAKLISQAGIRTLYYGEDFKKVEGLELLIKMNVKVEKL